MDNIILEQIEKVIMPDKINEKVISIFTRHKKHLPVAGDEKVVRTDDGFYYICVKKDDNGHFFEADKLLSRANNCHYIVKVMTNGTNHPYIYSYIVQGDKLLEFLSLYINRKKEGQVIEIDRYYPHDSA